MTNLDTSDMPQWIRDYAADLRDLFGLHEWKLWVNYADSPGGSDDTDGACDLDPRYLKAHITVRRGLDDDVRVRAVLFHEMLHVVLARFDQFSSRVLDLVDDELRAHVLDLYRDAEEATIERLTRALEPMVTPIAEKK